MREALTEALQDYTGALIVVAHDRHLLRATADELWLVADGALAQFDGDLDDYRQWVLARRGREAAATVADAAVPAPDRKTQKRAEAETRQRLSELRKPLQQKIERIERRIDLMSTEKRGLDEWLATSDAYIEENKERLIASLARRGDLAWELARDEAEWLELHEALERAAG
jgi:ATP-binding cassette subfamily F protein 3